MFRHRENRKRRSLRERLRDGCDRVLALGRRAGPWMVLAAVAVAVPCLVFFGYRRVLTSPYFQVSDIEIRGARHAEVQSLAEEAGLVHGVNIFEFDASEAVAILEGSPWVREATIERQLPDGLRVELEERRPGALLVDGGLHAVDRSGRPIERVDSDDRERMVELPLVTGLSPDELRDGRGRELVRDAMRVAQLYEELGLSERQALSEIHVDPVMGLTLVMEGTATEVRLGRGEYRERLERLARVRETLEKRGIEPSYLLMPRNSLERITVGRRRSQGSAVGDAE